MRNDPFNLDDLAASLVLTELSDSKAVAEMRDKLARIGEELGQAGLHPLAQRVLTSMTVLEDCLTVDFDPRLAASAFDELSQTIASLQQELDDEQSPATAVRTSGAPQEMDSGSTVCDPELLAGFISEAQEHLEAAEAHLLTLESDPHNQESLGAVFRAFHTIKGVAGFLDFKRIVTLAHEAENLFDLARSGELELSGAAIDVSLASIDTLKCQIEVLQGAPSAKAQSIAGSSPDLQERIRRVIAGEESTSRNHAVASAPPTSSAASTEEAPADDLRSTENSSTGRGKNSADAVVREAVKVDRDRLDKLIDMIGELVIAESMVHQLVAESGANLSRGGGHLAQLNKITRNLQQLSLSLRMVPIRGTFQKMSRVVRDLAKKIGKPVDFHVVGEETELDKTVVDQIGDPLVHLVRNSVDHGIERSVEERRAAGKPDHGQVTLRAFHQAGNIFVEIQDDGRGLDRAAILAKAREKGLLRDDANLSDREVYDLIFQPGFSTAKEVTDVSGRGVGMDVVRRNVEALRGAIDLRSEPGRGSTVSIRLPLTLAIIDGMVVRVGGHRYILPTLSLLELLRLDAAHLFTVKQKKEMLSVRGKLLPLFRIPDLLSLPNAGERSAQGIVAVVDDHGTEAGLLVDEIIGQHQVVIKNLGAGLEGQQGLAGGAVMPDGTVGLILDVHGLMSLAARTSPE